MHNTRIFILCALIAASQSYVLQNDQANEEYYFDDIQRNQQVYRQPKFQYVEEDEPHQQGILIALNRPKRQDHGSVSATVERNRQLGTNLNVEAQARLWESQNRRSTLDGTAHYQRNYGGQIGNQRPNYGVGLNFIHRF